MRSVVILCAVAALLLTPKAAAAAGVRADLAARYGIVLADGDGVEAWTQAEAATIAELMATLPAALQSLGLTTHFQRIRFFKNYAAGVLGATHVAPAVLFWQVQVAMGPDSSETPAADAAVFLRRRFVRSLMYVYDAYYHASEDPAWRLISGWRSRSYLGVTLPFVPREADNQDPRGYADADGMVGPGEDLATFAAFFFVPEATPVEASLACRTPEKFRYLNGLFPGYRGRPAVPAESCKPVAEGMLDDVRFFDPVTRDEIAMGPVDADSVEGFELLYATPGVGDAAEVAGHLILRVRLRNNPQAARLGVENPHDLVISFLADTEAGRPEPGVPPVWAPLPKRCPHGWFGFAAPQHGADEDPLRAIFQAVSGLSGGFYSIFDRQTLEQVVKTYTVDQDRSLLRYRLNLTKSQRDALLARLYAAKKNYRTKYYFFDRNCASILVRLIGEGIGDAELVAFDPLVVPPNALVALLIRKGLATEIHPAFFSYRKRGYVAQDELRERLAALARRYPAATWPNGPLLVSADEEQRLAGIAALAQIALAYPELDGALYQLAAFGQEAELAYADHGQRCDDYTSRTTAALRALQRQISAAADPAGVDINQIVYERYAGQEAADATLGSVHTGLAAIQIVGGRRTEYGPSGSRSEAVAVVDLALHRQDMGEAATQAMQRATAVTLGAVQAVVGHDDAGHATLLDGHVTGLALRKLKERLDEVPAYGEGAGSLGLGLTLLDARYHFDDQTRIGVLRGTVAGGELLANLASSRLYNRFLYVSVGAAVETAWGHTPASEGGFDKRETGLTLPIRLEGLWTFDAARAWQLRGQVEVRDGVMAGKITRGSLGEASLVHRLWEPNNTEVLVRFGASAEQLPMLDGTSGATTALYSLGMEWNRW